MRQVKRVSAQEAARLVKDGDVLLVGGFGMTGNPVRAQASTPFTERLG